MTPPVAALPSSRRTLWVVLGACAAILACACLVTAAAGAVYTFRSRRPSAGLTTTACDHRYLPIRQGASWTYRTSNGDLTWRIVSVIGGPGAATAEVSAEFGFGPVGSTWMCDLGGVRYDRFVDFVGLDGVENYEISAAEGYSLVPAQQLEGGATWSNAYTVRSAGNSTRVSETLSAGSPTDVDTSLGAFIVIPVETVRSATTEGDAGASSTESSSVLYFAQDVGIVRVETRTEGGLQTAELTAVSIPPAQ